MAAAARALRLVAFSRPSATRGSSSSLLTATVHRRLQSATAAGAGDTAVHSGGAPSDDYADRPPRFSGAEEAIAAATTGGQSNSKRASTPPPPQEGGNNDKDRVPPFAPSGKLGSQELADPTGASSFTQKRRLSSRSPGGSDSREAATPGAAESAARKVREEDREYYRARKPSPLAEVEFADTRKPITRATDSGAADAPGDAAAAAVVEDTVDDSLARAEAMFREAASRGNPDWPHSRALAEMLARRQHQQQQQGSHAAPWGS